MPAQRITMRKLREVLRLRLHAELSMRQIRDSLKLSLGAIQNVTCKAEELGLDWKAIEQLDDQQLAAQFYPESDSRQPSRLQMPDWVDVHQELKRKGVTKLLLWEEYTQQYPNRCYSYSQYCTLYLEWLKKQRRSMRQTHKAGEKLFVDYAGQTVPIVCQATGEIMHNWCIIGVRYKLNILLLTPPNRSPRFFWLQPSASQCLNFILKTIIAYSHPFVGA